MPIYENENTVTVGSICQSCGLLLIKQCPYNNHLKNNTLEYKGDIRGKCIYYETVEEDYAAEEFAGNNSWYKFSNKEPEKNLNIELFKKIAKLDEKSQQRMFSYWKYLFPPNYAEQMITDKVETKPKNRIKKQRRNKK